MGTTKTDVIFPEILEDTIRAGFASMSVMQGTGAVIVRPGLQDGPSKVNTTVTVPYFSSIGAAEELASDGDALTPKKISQTGEDATVKHAGIATEITYWAQGGVGDPYAEASRQSLDAIRRYYDDKAVEAAVNETSWTNYIKDGSSATINYDVLVDTRALFGDEAKDFAAFVCHSKVYTDLLKIKDSSGRPILVDLSNAGEPRLTIFNIPIVQSDKFTATGGVYKSVLLKRGAIAIWVDTQSITVLTDKDILANSDIAAIHVYQATHRYRNLDMSTKPGVAILKTK